jgi:hypothetical protein
MFCVGGRSTTKQSVLTLGCSGALVALRTGKIPLTKAAKPRPRGPVPSRPPVWLTREPHQIFVRGTVQRM